jgi:hypothetical protein
MNEKEVAEIRRRLNISKSNISCIRGCYVNERKEIVSQFNQFFGTMPKEEAEEILTLVKKTLSGTLNKNLLDIEFLTKQVMEGEEHKLLMTLKDSELKDDESAEKLYKNIIQSVDMEESYMIILAFDKYDIPSYTKDDIKLEDSADIFSYFICAICPVKLRKSALGYRSSENSFINISPDRIITSPQLGFMFPSFDDRQTNIYNALFYTKDTSVIQEKFIETIFKSEIPMPAEAQKEIFNRILEESVSDDCDYEVVQTVHTKIAQMIEEHKANKEEEPLVISKGIVKNMLSSCGVAQEHIESFDEKYNDEFGEYTQISPKNIVDNKKFEISTPDIVIKVNPECSSLIKTQIIDGSKYILIRADDNVEVNGVNINIK